MNRRRDLILLTICVLFATVDSTCANPGAAARDALSGNDGFNFIHFLALVGFFAILVFINNNTNGGITRLLESKEEREAIEEAKKRKAAYREELREQEKLKTIRKKLIAALKSRYSNK